MKNLLILGAGTAGTMMAHKLSRALNLGEWDITVIDRTDTHYYQPGFLFLPFGRSDPKDLVRAKHDLLPTTVRFVVGEVARIAPPENCVYLTNDQVFKYDFLLIATGAAIHPEEVEGLEGEHWGESIFNFYTYDGALALREALKNFNSGKVVVHVAEMPIKCPVAPIEFLFLADDYFTKRGIRDQVELHYITPLPGAFTKPQATEKLSYLLANKKITLDTDFATARIDNATKHVVSWDERAVAFDLLVTIPTNKGDAVIERSGLGDDLNFVPTDKYTLRSQKHANIFVIGDATNVPASKAGSVAHFESDIVLANVLSAIAGKPLEAKFDGHANCFIESGYDKGLLIDFNYDVEPLPGRFPLPGVGPFTLLGESHTNHFGKLAFRWIYWNRLLPGREMPFVESHMTMAGKVTA